MEIFLLVFLTVLILEFRPVKKLNKLESNLSEAFPFPEGIDRYRIITHVHTQFSFDSLGKPSDIKKAMEENNIDYVFIADHDNDNYRFFEDEKIFAGVEKNTPDGRLLLLGNELPVISHPNNFEFDHYRWKGEFKKDYLYEIIDIKDAVVWKKALSVVYLLKNLLIYPITRKVLHKWNVLIPLEKWFQLYYRRARGLKIVGGLDLHIKLVYQEHTHGVLIPSYREGFKWLVNVGYSRKRLSSKKEVIDLLKEGKVFLSMKQTEGDFWGQKEDKVFFFWEKMPVGSYLNGVVKRKKVLIFLYLEDKPLLITEKNSFSYRVKKEGLYHFQVYEYDFKIGNFYFGFRPLIITNMFEVVNG